MNGSRSTVRPAASGILALSLISGCGAAPLAMLPKWLSSALGLSQPDEVVDEEKLRTRRGMPPRGADSSVLVHNNRAVEVQESSASATPNDTTGIASRDGTTDTIAQERERNLALREIADPLLLGLPRMNDARVRVESLVKDGPNEVVEFVFVSNASPKELAAIYQQSLREKGLEVQDLEHNAGTTKSVHLFGRNPEMRYSADFERIDDLHATRASMRFQKKRELSDEEFLGVDLNQDE